MEVRVITLRYDERLGGFAEEPLRAAMAGREVVATREHFFVQGGVAHLVIVLELQGTVGNTRPPYGGPTGPDPMQSVPPERRKLYLDLKKWRNTTAEKEGVPPFVVLRNEQLAAVATKLPRNLAALREIEGIGEKTCGKYGQQLLDLLPASTEPRGTEKPPCAPSEGSSTAS